MSFKNVFSLPRQKIRTNPFMEEMDEGLETKNRIETNTLDTPKY